MYCAFIPLNSIDRFTPLFISYTVAIVVLWCPCQPGYCLCIILECANKGLLFISVRFTEMQWIIEM